MSGPRIGLLSAWLSRRNGGVFEAVAAQAAMIRAGGGTPVVIGLADTHSDADGARLGGAEVIHCRVAGPRRLGWAPAMTGALAASRLDLLHLHGLWTWPSAAAAGWARATGRPLLVSPHGMLHPWILARGRLRKRIARGLFEGRAWRAATLFHALTPGEADDIRAATGRGGAAVVPNAVARGAIGPSVRAPVLLYLGRIHPKKNLSALIDGWDAAAAMLHPLGARLEIAGWGERAHLAALEARIARTARADVRFVGPLHGTEKWRALAGARFAVLPSLSEGLPMAMLEAWAAGTPTLMSAACNLPCGIAAGAAIDCGTTPRAIAAALRAAFRLGEREWGAMSAAASGLAAGPFSPEAVGARWAGVYDALIARRPVPCAS